MSKPFRSLALRPFLPADTPLLASIFAASVEQLTGDDYDPGQQAAWAGLADDEDQFAKRLAGQLTLVATIDGAPVAFANESLGGAEGPTVLAGSRECCL